MKKDLINLCYNAIFSLTILVMLALPLIFLPVATDFFETQKFNLVLIVTLLGLFIWTLRMILEKSFTFTKSSLDIGIFALLLTFGLSSFFSVNRYQSFIGLTDHEWPNFLSLCIGIALFYLLTSNLKNKKQLEMLLLALTTSTVLASLVSIAAYFGLFLPFDFAKTRTFSTFGTALNLSLFQAILLPATFGLVIVAKGKSLKMFYALSTIVIFKSLILTNFIPAYVSLIAIGPMILTAFLLLKLRHQDKLFIGAVAACLILLTIIRFTPTINTKLISPFILKGNLPKNENAGLEIEKSKLLPQSAGWIISANTLAKQPLLGTGPSTFPITFTQLKPRAMNYTDLWSFRFVKSSSDITEYIATVGLLGTAAFLLFIGQILRLIYRLIAKTKKPEYIALAAPLLSFMIISFFSFSIFSTFIVFILMLSIFVSYAKINEEKFVSEITLELAALKRTLGLISKNQKTSATKPKTKSQILPYVFFLVLLIISSVLIKHEVSAIAGEYFMRQAFLAEATSDGRRTLINAETAIKWNPYPDSYHRYLSDISLRSAISVNSRSTLSDEEKNIIGDLAQAAIDRGKIASGYQILPLRVPGMSPLNVANWETLAHAYQTVIGAFQGADTNALTTLAEAVSLDPENPILHDNLGMLFQRLKRLDDAQRKFEDALIVKNDYGLSHYHLAKLLIEKESSPARILEELKAAKQFLKEDPQIKDIERQLDIFTKKAQEQQDQEKLKASSSPSPIPTPSPSPTPNPSPSATPSPSPTPAQ